MDEGLGIVLESPWPPLPRRRRLATLPPPSRGVAVERGGRRAVVDGAGHGVLSPDLGREDATMEFVADGVTLSPVAGCVEGGARGDAT